MKNAVLVFVMIMGAGVILSHQDVLHSAANPYKVSGAPTIQPGIINLVLDGSPAQGTGGQLYTLGLMHGVDPAFALAVFKHESNFGRDGIASQTLSLGNIRCTEGYTCIDGFRAYGSWSDGYADFDKLIRDYVDVRHLVDVPQIIPVYCPDGTEAAYIKDVETCMDKWKKGVVDC